VEASALTSRSIAVSVVMSAPTGLFMRGGRAAQLKKE